MTFGSLSFLNPLILLALFALPLIWWLLRATPPMPETVKFPAFMILKRLKNDEETPDSTPWWLLLIRLLLAAFVITGLAAPVLNAPEIEPVEGPLVMVIDNTYAAAQGWTSRRSTIERIAEQSRQTKRPVFVLTTPPAYPVGTPSIVGPLTSEGLRDIATNLDPVPFAADRAEAIATLDDIDDALQRYQATANGTFTGSADYIWLSDGLASGAASVDQAFADALMARGSLALYTDDTQDSLALAKQDDVATSSETVFSVSRLDAGIPWEGTIVATARDGRELGRANVSIPAGARNTTASIKLPLALQNDLASVKIENARTPASVWFADARDRRALIGLQNSEREQSAALLSGNHYIREALAPFAEFQTGDISALVRANVSVIVLDDVGRLRDEDKDLLTEWIERGGILIRFAGPNLADAALDATPALLPVSLRQGERAFGGALTWDTPQPLGDFSAEGPFSNLSVPVDIFVRQQILAQPGGETSEHTWASLTDGTPLVTGRSMENGLIVLFHITATPVWSDLPLSEVFIDMLRKLTFLSSLGPSSIEQTVSEQNLTRYAPLRMLDGFGRFQSPPPGVSGITLNEADMPPTPLSPPGLYGAPDSPIAINTITQDSSFEAMQVSGMDKKSYAVSAPNYLWALFFLFAFLLLLIDMIGTLFLTGKLGQKIKPTTATTSIAIAAIITGVLAMSTVATSMPAYAYQSAQSRDTKPLDPPIDPKIAEATLTTQFAYVITGNQDTDRISKLGLTALSQELSRRTTVSPAAPVGIDLRTDDFSIYPILYWPIEPNSRVYPDNVLAEVEAYMRLGGLIIFDTKDEERSVSSRETAEGATLRNLLSRIDIPPLVHLTKDHVLRRSYYLLPELRGRTGEKPVWVAAGSTTNDGVTPIIIGGRDWAGAWARSDNGNPARPMINNRYNDGERAREFAYRSGINMAMVAFTGNYKTDQVHAAILLRRLGDDKPVP